MNEKILGMIGLALRAGKLSVGGDKCEKAIRQGLARLVIVAEDASENTKKSVTNACRYYNIEYKEAALGEELGRYTGSNFISAVSVNDDNFAKAILDRLNQSLRENEKG